MMLMKLIIICCSLISILSLISHLLKMKKMNLEKFSPFECGFDSNHESRNSFSLRFFIFTVIFLVFDTEVTLLLPLPLMKENNFYSYDSFLHTMLFLILLIGLMFEWKQGALNWMWFYI